MYKYFFGFRERPFKLVPNPAYLFLSRNHEEALAHLTYAISQGDGFVEITGEVGTGKTTICRAFLENLDENTEAAYIFNPKLDSIQLLKAINDEFCINSDSDNIKDLIDTLNAFLMEKKSQGAKVALLIDEAQNLSIEVLEQLRLLSNLETTMDKLLQIILVGQPELGEILDSDELRQLGQRITLSCHITPLTYKEMREYIQHRINIASKKPGVKFVRAAFRSIYKYSEGIPRLVNIACDRALLTAYGLNRHKITRNIARKSIRELAGRGGIKHYGLREGKKVILTFSLFLLTFSLLCITLIMIILFQPGTLNLDSLLEMPKNKMSKIFQTEQLEIKTPVNHAPDKELIKDQAKKVREIEPVMKPMQNLGDFLKDMDMRSSRRSALMGIMDMWDAGAEIEPHLDGIDDNEAFFLLAAKQNGFLIHRIECDLNMVKRLDLPAILEFYLPGVSFPRYLAVSKIDDAKITLIGGGEDNLVEVDPYETAPYWSGMTYIPWKNFFGYSGNIPLRSPKDSIITLKIHMRDIGFNEVEINSSYDDATKKAVKEIQAKHGIPVDGIVGPLTKIVLYNEERSLKIPHINDE